MRTKQGTLIWRKIFCSTYPCIEQEVLEIPSCQKCCWFCVKLDTCISDWRKGKAYCVQENRGKWCSRVLLSYLQQFTQVKDKQKIYNETFKRIERRAYSEIRKKIQREISNWR